MDNQRRATQFQKALDSYGMDASTVLVTDMLADAMHWCDANGEDFHLYLAMACRHYINELNDEQQDERRMNP